MRSFELTTAVGAPPELAFDTLLDLETWSAWNRLVPSAAGRVAVGERLAFEIRRDEGGFRRHRPTVLSVHRPDEVVLAADFLARWLLRMEHSFRFVADGAGCRLVQRWKCSGLLVAALWPDLVATMERFAELGRDLDAEARRRQT
jgi:uncharacterized protein YndB with AHSA1/START domain